MASMYSHEPLGLEKDQENKSNSTESDSATNRKRKASIDRKAPQKRRRRSWITTETSQPSYGAVSARGGKRKASTERKSLKKRYRASTSRTCRRPTSPTSSSRSYSPTSSSSSNWSLSPSSSSGSSRTRATSRTRRSPTSPASSASSYTPTSSTSSWSSSWSLSPSSSSSSSSSPTKREEVFVEDVQEITRKRKSSPCEETPSKRQKSSELIQSFCSSSSSEVKKGCTLPTVKTSRADFEENYMQFHRIGEEGCGSVYAGFRLTDYLPVAIKHIQGPHITYEMNVYKIAVEVALMHKVAGGPESVGKCAAVSLLDWYYLDNEVILITERPVPSVVFTKYLDSQGGTIGEQEAKIFLNQLVDAAVEMHCKGVFHRDIKSGNILIEMGSGVPRVRIINFECSSTIQERVHHTFSGSLACAPPEWYARGEYRAGPTTVWQLGALLYRMLHGFKNSTMGILYGRMQLSSDSATQLSHECLNFLKLCLEKDPEKRATLQQLQRHPWLK